ncbi:phospholipase D-like domain-containing protein [Actinomarinicola tropica]|uniref:Cardiolipin synthase B n=1 Tax=Actinomarinicola tropica TaxID=2789776 RepID=A0A5Q2RLT3_9ACTN|nr:phospholipase D-like domain-containing protein [Actinomarinicola tropica]QGG95386.1 cardiolipin synthase B [Actinomarinicola tropica]
MIDDERTDKIRRTLEGLLGSPASDGNRLEVLRNGDQIFPAMLDAIAASTRTIDFLTFIYWTGDIGRRFAEAFAERARHGVRVRVLLDAVGSRLIDEELVGMMEDGGCDVQWFRPVEAGALGEVNHRTHRKVLVCDETTAFTGGVGIADEWTGDARSEDEWRDTHFLVEGPAVLGLRGAFVDNWAETGAKLFDPEVDRFPELQPSGDRTIQVVKGAAETGWSDIATMFRSLVLLAEENLRITTAYFNPDDLLRELICDTSRRGVRVQVLIPGPHADKRFVQLASESAYAELLDAGVEIHNFQTSMLHAKVLTIDGLVASVGSANVNNRSTLFDEEVNLIVYDREITAILDEHFEQDLRSSVEIDMSRWEERSAFQKAAETVIQTAKDLI